MREGAYDYLVKPTDVEELKLRVAHVFERHRLTDELKRRVAELEAANATIDEMNASLRSRIDEATAQLRAHVEELSRTKAELEAARAQKEQFIAMVAHELRSPLTPLRFATQLIDRQPAANDAIHRYTATIQEQVDRLERLIQDLLDVSRIDTGRFSIQPGECDLSALASQLIESYRQRHADRRFVLAASDEPVVGIFDCGRIEQALNNLLDNAVKYSFPDTTVTLALSLRPDGWIDLSVADEGMGIPTEQMQAIFEPFRRLDAARDTQGFGLGLAIAKGIAEAHGGHLSVASETSRARGATFTISLPLTTPDL
jgi:signal transduction histidine kinase